MPLNWFVLTLCGLIAAPAPAAPSTQPALEQGKILILPFVAVNKNDSQPWLGRSVQQSLVADLTMVAPDRATSNDTEATDTESALAAGRKADASYVVTGSFTTIGQDLRLTGQVLDVRNSRTLGGLKVTGSVNEIFQLEDGLARQIKARLALGRSQGGSTAVAQDTEPATMAPLRVEQAPPPDLYYQSYSTPAPSNYSYNYYYSSDPYGYGYDYPYYWGYPGYGYLFIGGSFRSGHFHHGFHDGFHSGFHDHGFSGGFHSHGFGGGFRSGGFSGGGHFGGRGGGHR